MKKMLTAGLMALGLVLSSQQTAPAWINFKVGFGFNWQWQSGNNSLFWGMWHDGQVPHPAFYGPPHMHGPVPHFHGPVNHVFQPVHVDLGPPPMIAPPHHNHGAPMPNWTPPPPQPVNPEASYRVPGAYSVGGYGDYGFNSYYQPASWHGW